MKALIFFLMLYSINSAAASVAYEKVAVANSARVGKVVIRYLQFFSSPCLDVQILAPDQNWEIVSTKSFCDFKGQKLFTDFSYAGFEEISIVKDGVHLTLSMFPLKPIGEERRECTVPIEHQVIGDLICTEPMKT